MAIVCLPREFKSAIIPFLRSRAKYYENKGDDNLSGELRNLADVIRDRIALCTNAGNPSGSWLKRHGYTKNDLRVIGEIVQVVD